mgnify:CR=1 FL=1
MGFRERIKKINIKGIWERNAFYILLAVCILIMGAVAWTSRSRQQPAPQAPPGEERMAATPFPEPELERRSYTLQAIPGRRGTQDTEPDEEPDTASEEAPEDTKEPDDPDTEDPVEQSPSSGMTTAEETVEATGDAPEEAPADPAVQTAAQSHGWQNPLPGIIVTRYAADQLVYWETLGAWRVHPAIDIKPERDTAVCAAADGTVSLVTEDDMLGHMIVIDHDGGLQTCYASLTADLLVTAGDLVLAGQQIGTAGDTARSEQACGVHLHFAVWADGQSADPLSYISVP